jgi:hypothetical protein
MGQDSELAKIDDGHYLCAYRSDKDEGWATVLTVDTGTWTVSQKTPVRYDSKKAKVPDLHQIDSTHYLCAYQGDGDDGYAVVLTVNTGTWAISVGTPFEFDTSNGQDPAIVQMDSTHYLVAYGGMAEDGYAVILTVNTGSWTISKGTELEFDTVTTKTPVVCKLDNQHCFCVYVGQLDWGRAVTLTVNTSNWTISEETQTVYDERKSNDPDLIQVDSTHFICAYQGPGDDGWACILELGATIRP